MEAALWAWVNEQYAATVVAQNRAHVLVFVQAQVAFSALEKACAPFHAYAGQRGQAPHYHVGQLCRALLVKYLHGWSYRQTEREIRGHSLVRWFVGYALTDATLDHLTLWRFEQWVKQQHARLFFDEILKQIDQAHPTEVARPQIGDTFALVSRACEQSRTALLRKAAHALLNYLAAVTPTGHAALLADCTVGDLFGHAHEPPEYYLTKVERDALEIRTATAAHALLRRVTAQRLALGHGAHEQRLEYHALLRWAQVLAKILADEFVITCTPDGDAASVTHHTEKTKRKGSYRHGSTVDLDATFRVHGEKTHLGYNAHLAVTTNFVREINAQPGAAPDNTGVANLITQQKRHLGVVPPKLIYDRAAGMPKIFADVHRASAGQTQLVARLIDHSKNRQRFGPSDFTLNEVGQLTCPNGQIAAKVYRSGSADGVNYRFLPAQCHACPRLAQCHGTAVAPDHHRQVFISDYIYFQRDALAYLKTAAGQADLALRPHVERIIAALTRYNNARHAAALGLANADFQLKMCALAYNLKRWHTLDQERRKPPRPKPPPDA